MPKVVIELSDKEYENIKALDYLNIGRMNSKPLIFAALHGIKCGTVLPKGHGDLIDRNKLKQAMKIGYRIVDDAETVIKADNEVE